MRNLQKSGPVRFVSLLTVVCLVSLSVPAIAQMKGKMKVPADEVMTMSKYEFSETVSRLKQAIEEENLMVLRTLDMQEMLKMVGVETKGMQTILFFHPRYGKTIYTTAKMAGIEPPLKLTVMVNQMGKTVIRYRKPSAIFAAYKPLAEMGAELDAVSERIVGSVKAM